MEKNMDYLGFATQKEILSLFESDEKIIFSGKIHKFNPFGWKQERNMVITNKHLFNLKKTSPKRKINILNVAAVTITSHPESKEFVIHVPSEYDYRYTSERREEIVQLLKQIYYKIHAKPFPLYIVSNYNLKEYTTTKSEKKKNKFRIPEEKYRSPDEVPAAPSKPGTEVPGTGDETKAAVDLFETGTRSFSASVVNRAGVAFVVK